MSFFELAEANPMSGVFRNIEYWPPTPSPPGEIVPPPTFGAGGTHSLGGKGVGGQ